MQRAHLASDVLDVVENRSRADIRRALRRHDQMLAALAWVIEQAAELHRNGPPLDPLYEAYDFVHEMRHDIAPI